jgi:HAD superfamily hydrolase (TIGR01509 family)
VALSLSPNVLFDLDGTLVDSGPLHDAAYRKVLREHMPALSQPYRYDNVKGRPTREAWTALGVRDAKELSLLTLAKQQAYRALLVRLELLPGARQVLDALRAVGSAMFLVTSGSRVSVMSALRATGIAFRGVTTADDVRAGKPAPEPYLCCLRRHGLHPRTCVAVEDSMSGVISARKAGLPVVGVHDSGIAGSVDEFFPSLLDFERWIHSHAVRGAVP